MSTALELATDSLRLLGVIASGETLGSSEANDALRALNRMLDSWSTKNLMVLGITMEEFTLTIGTNSYTLGSGGDFSTTVPVKIDALFIKDSDGNELPVELTFDSKRWGAISTKSSRSNYPTLVYVDQNYPLRNVYVYPTPSEANTLIFHNARQLSQLSTLSTSLSLPKGYEDAIIYNLAVRLAPEYGVNVSAEIAKLASETFTDIKRNNIRPVEVGLDAAVTGYDFWDYRTGGLT